METAQFDFGIIGVGVMGSNLLLNLADHGFKVLGYDKNKEKTHLLEQSARPGTTIKGVNTIPEMMDLLAKPRKIMFLVPAGKIVDDVINDLLPFVDDGDILVDGGNSHYTDTLRRITYLQDKKIHFVGAGISGGEEGARTGPSIMPGGDEEAYRRLEPLFVSVAASVDNVPCVAYLGKDAAGHYVKMVHNGIEYAIMQLISEVYDLLKNVGGLSNSELAQVFADWNQGELQSFLVEITAHIFKEADDKTSGSLVDMILDKAGAKGTGKWTSQDALDISVPIPCIDAAVTMRNISSLKDQRVKASALYPIERQTQDVNKAELIKELHDALLFAVIASYAQGLNMLSVASVHLNMQIDMLRVINVWKGGCIIRSSLLKVFELAYSSDPNLQNLFLHPDIAEIILRTQGSVRTAVSKGIQAGLPMGAMTSGLYYFDAFRAERLPVNLVQAQRDFFGAHTYERIDQPGVFHTEWNVVKP
ncbi:NADP-dependent phosphogluconate dehydrogenase [Segetibacter sp. 3557_3]|uniref:NADP-dependent phosphogluconate dehydrogenase n=1 Tax=Segetibacter sp. 3557_3 TaxID=2547429 RepID=UPI00105885CF|nr:NADP-dependent phosphogluconate dehydrogenase [Segetibacter sp. 3557_3]TDH18342.1 NADP-dependent phosphogluconate dehydrogenase [Segetibacter sp. 3557_3]